MLSFGPDSSLYGTTYCNGGYGKGNIFKLSNTQNGWSYASLHDFTGGNDGGNPISNVTFDSKGNLYGTASTPGVVWMLKP